MTIRVLYLDDDPTVLATAENYFARYVDDITVETTTDPDHALDRMATGEIDCLLCEQELPTMDGLAVLDRLRSEGLDVAPIMYTELEGIEREARSLGAVAVVRKRTDASQFETLAATIRDAVGTDDSATDPETANDQGSARDQETRTAADDRMRSTAADDRICGVVGLDEAGEIQTVDDAAARILDASREDLLGATAAEVFGEETAARIQTCRERAETIEQPVGFTLVERAVQGSVHPGPAGVTLQLSVTDMDHQRLVETKERFDSVLDATDTGIWEWNTVTDDVFWNESATQLLGTESGTFTETYEGFLGRVHPDDRRVIEDAIDRLLADGKRCEPEFRIQRAAGPPQWIAARLMAVTDDDGTERVVGTFTDITDRKQYEREIERKNDWLELMSSTISHDLRSPLRSAQSHLRMARKEPDDELLAEVERAHERMEELITDLLALAEQGDTVDETEIVDIATVAETTWDGVDAPAATLTTEPTAIPADRTRLEQLFQNLFVNAISHGGDEVTVRVGPTPDGFFVADTGSGIPADEREMVFEYGFTTSETGTGFGLAIVGQIADAHGWDISITDSADGGARFEFVI